MNKSDQVSETGNLEVITRHEALMTTKIEASYALKVSIEEIKFIKKEPEDEIQAWVKDIEEQLRIADERAFALRRLKERFVKERREMEKTEADKQQVALDQSNPFRACLTVLKGQRQQVNAKSN